MTKEHGERLIDIALESAELSLDEKVKFVQKIEKLVENTLKKQQICMEKPTKSIENDENKQLIVENSKDNEVSRDNEVSKDNEVSEEEFERRLAEEKVKWMEELNVQNKKQINDIKKVIHEEIVPSFTNDEARAKERIANLHGNVRIAAMQAIEKYVNDKRTFESQATEGMKFAYTIDDYIDQAIKAQSEVEKAAVASIPTRATRATKADVEAETKEIEKSAKTYSDPNNRDTRTYEQKVADLKNFSDPSDPTGNQATVLMERAKEMLEDAGYETMREAYNKGEPYARLCKLWDYFTTNCGWPERPGKDA